MKTFRYIIIAAAAICAPASALAQASYSGYFLDNYVHRYQLNPALRDTTEKAFFTFPALGNLNAGMNGNLHTTSLVYNVNGKTVLFTSPDVPASDVLSKIHSKNRLGVAMNMDILAAGWKAWGGYNAVTISAVADANVGVPGELFKLVKEGISNKTYDIKNFMANASAYAKIQLNHSRDIKQVPGLRVGAALKFYLGLGNVDAYFNEAQLELGQDAWIARTNADVYASVKGLSYQRKYNDKTDRYYVNGVDMDGFGLTGFGLGFDLGGTYKWRDFNFSAAVLDLGFISWSNTQFASTDGTQTVNTDGYIFGTEKGQADDEWDRLSDDLSNLYQLTDHGDMGARTRAARATLNFGVSYVLPYYRNLTFGILNSTRLHGRFTSTDFRFSANVMPVKCFSASANFTAGTFGVGFGWLVNLNVKGFSLFVGMDRTFGKLAKQGVPLNSNGDFNFGINFPL